jgi:hypothetical protein
MAPVLPQLSSVTSEALQAQIRALLPSQDGFGADLAASNVIQPVIDLTAAAEGTTTPVDLLRSASFGNVTSWSAQNATTVIANTVGFYRIYGISTGKAQGGGTDISNILQLSDGLSTKNIWEHVIRNSSGQVEQFLIFDINVFLASGESVSAISSNSNAVISGSVWQIADVNGNATNPSGFSPQ